MPSLIVVQGSIKNEQSMTLNHVVYTVGRGKRPETNVHHFQVTILEEALDICRRDMRKLIWEDVTFVMKKHPLWRMAHIAILCQRVDIFMDDGLAYLHQFEYSVNDVVHVACSPEALMLAIQTNQESIVRFLLKHGADLCARDPMGNNAIQLRVVNPLCMKTLFNFGGELLYKSTDKNLLFELIQSNKGSTPDAIRVLLEKSPSLLNERDITNGNTCLHAVNQKTSLLSLLHLKHKEMDLNAKNKSGFTPLHQFVIREDIGMVMCLLSYGAGLDERAYSGKMTALHFAVSKRNLQITRFLLCLGADPNLANAHGDTPRHLAAKLNEVELLKSLIICEARRCPLTKVGCVSGCVNEKALHMLKNPSSIPAMALPSSSSNTTTKNTAGGYTSVMLEDFEKRKFDKEEYRFNKLLDLEHNAVYDEIFQKLADLCAEGHAVDHNFINVLSLDGGGIRGLVILQILVCIERILGEPIFPYFDWVAGTSTGALITAGLTMGQSLREIQRLYLRFKDLVFDNRRPHNTRILELFIRNELGSDTKFSDLKDPMILFTTTRADFFPVQLELMRNYKLPTTDEENEELGYETPENLLLWKVLRRSSAAPTYFASVDNKYIDGGIIANNPTLELLQEVQFWNSFNRYKNLPNSVNIGCVLSIGTGAIPPSPLEPTYLELAQNWATQPITSFNVALTIGSILVDQVTATEGVPVLRSGSVCLHARAPFFRLSAPLFKNIEMDAKDDADTARMMWNCMEYMYKHRDYVEKLCALLRRVGHACHRRHMFQQFGTRTQQDQQTQTSRSSSPAGELLKMLNTDNISNKQQQKDDDEGNQ